MEIKYSWLDSFHSSEEKFLKDQIAKHIDKERLGRCRCGELKVIVSGDFRNQSYKARIQCSCNDVQGEVRGAIQK